MNRKFFILISIFISCCVAEISTAQNSRVGDGFGGRLWYKPYNFSTGSYSAFTTCDTNNQLYGWGSSGLGELDSSILSTIVPVKIPGMTHVEYISGGYLIAAIRYDHSGWCWGGGRPYIARPTKVIDSVIFADASSHSCSFVKRDGTVWSVGKNSFGVFGDGNWGTPSKIPKKMTGVNNAVRTALGRSTQAVLLSDSTVMSVGTNGEGGLGLPGASLTTIILTAQKIPGLEDIIDIKASYSSHIALDKNGDVWQWGGAPAYFTGPHTFYFTPQKLSGLKDIVAISGCEDGQHFLALDEFHKVYAWMSNDKGQCGFPGSLTSLDSPMLVDSNAVDILAGETFSYIIKQDGNLYASGQSTTDGRSIWLDKAYYDTVLGGPPRRFTKINPGAFLLCTPQKKEYLRPRLRLYDSFYCAGDSALVMLPSYGTLSLPYSINVSPDTGYVIDSAHFKMKFYTTAGIPVTYTVTTSPKDTTDPFFVRDTLIFTPRIYPGPTADFTFSPYKATIADPKFTFISRSKNAVKYRWYQNDTLLSDSLSFSANFPGVGKYCVKLVASNQCGLEDTVSYCFAVVDTTKFLPPEDTLLCMGEDVAMNFPIGYKPLVTPATGFTWDSVAHILRFSPISTTKYTVIKDPEIIDTAFARDTIIFTLHVLPIDTINSRTDTSFCLGSSLLYTATTKGDFGSWNNSDTSRTKLVTDAGTYWSYTKMGCAVYIDTLVVTISGDTSIGLLDTALCFVKSFSAAPAKNYTTYLWNDGSSARENTFTTEGTKWVIAKQDSCHIHIDTFKVSFVNFNLNIFDTALCNGKPIMLNAAIPLSAKYKWQNGSNEKTHTVKQPGYYWVEVAVGACMKKKEIVVASILEDFDLGQDIIACEGQAVTLEANVDSTFELLWQTGETTKDIVAQQSGTYQLTVSKEGCVVTDRIFVTFKECNNCLKIPNAFTPNSDGKNDAFKPIISCMAKSYSMIIMNRYGQKVFQSDHPEQPWDGRFNNTDEEVGVYYYLIKVTFDYPGATEELYKGDISLVR